MSADRDLLLRDMQANPIRYFSTKDRPSQTPFFYDPHTVIALLGGNRAGKSDDVVVYCIAACLGKEFEPFDLPGMLSVTDEQGTPILKPPPLFVRYFVVDLIRTGQGVILKKFLRYSPPRMLDRRYGKDGFNRETNTLHLKNGSFIQFMSYDSQDLKQQSANPDIVVLDEAPKHSTFEAQFARVLDSGGRIFLAMTLVDTAPWPVDWVDSVIVNARGKTRKYVSYHEVSTEENIQALAKEDQVRGGRILHNLEAMKTVLRPETLATVLYGKGAFLKGVVYKEFNEADHTFRYPGITPEHFPALAGKGYGDVWCGFDHGQAQPTAVLYIFVARHAIPAMRIVEGDCIQFDEYYRSSAHIVHHLPELQSRQHRYSPRGYVCDPSMWKEDKLAPGVSDANLYQDVRALKAFIKGTPYEHPIEDETPIGPLYPGSGGTIEPGIQLVHALLAKRPDPFAWPRYRIVEGTCPFTYESMRGWSTKTDTEGRYKDDRYTQHNKHIPDALRYFAASPALDSLSPIADVNILRDPATGAPLTLLFPDTALVFGGLP